MKEKPEDTAVYSQVEMGPPTEVLQKPTPLFKTTKDKKVVDRPLATCDMASVSSFKSRAGG